MSKWGRSVTLGVMAFWGILLVAFVGENIASAMTYQDETTIQFTFNSTLSIALSDVDIHIDNLVPGQEAVSNTLNVIVNSNNQYGYTLQATVGNAGHKYRDLRHTNGTANIASIDTEDTLETLTNNSSSAWGYSVSFDNNTWTKYKGLPRYDSYARMLRMTSGAAADSTTFFRIGAYVPEGQLAGDYSNVINFSVVSNVNIPFLQDITAENGPTEGYNFAIDKRDGKLYMILCQGGFYCEMHPTINLDGGTPLYSDTSNVPDGYPSSGGVPYYTLPASTADASNGVYNSNLENIGTDPCTLSYYNYIVATAGTNPSSGDAQYSICPKGWRMLGKTEYYDQLVQQVDPSTIDTCDLNGYFENGVFYGDGVYGHNWTATAYDVSNAYYLSVSNANLSVPYGSKTDFQFGVSCYILDY